MYKKNSRKILCQAAGLLALCACFVSGTHAGLIVAVEGTEDSIRSVNADEGLAISFEILTSVEAVDIYAPIDCFNCTGSIFLTTNIGTDALISDLGRTLDFTSLSSSLLFENLTLSTGTYFLGLGVESGFAVWGTTGAPLVLNTPQGLVKSQYDVAELNASLLIASDFLINSQDAPLLFSVNSAMVPPSEIPIAGTTGLLAIGVFAMGFTRSRRRVCPKRN